MGHEAVYDVQKVYDYDNESACGRVRVSVPVFIVDVVRACTSPLHVHTRACENESWESIVQPRRHMRA